LAEERVEIKPKEESLLATRDGSVTLLAEGHIVRTDTLPIVRQHVLIRLLRDGTAHTECIVPSAHTGCAGVAVGVSVTWMEVSVDQLIAVEREEDQTESKEILLSVCGPHVSTVFVAHMMLDGHLGEEEGEEEEEEETTKRNRKFAEYSFITTLILLNKAGHIPFDHTRRKMLFVGG
jgi:hypothetical protein